MQMHAHFLSLNFRFMVFELWRKNWIMYVFVLFPSLALANKSLTVFYAISVSEKRGEIEMMHFFCGLVGRFSDTHRGEF